MDKLTHNFHTLPNGMKVLFIKDKRYKVSTITLTLNAGSIFEKENKDGGYFHMVEHMLFQSSKKYDNVSRDNEYRNLGARYNGGTSLCITNYHVDCPSENVNKVFDLFFDMIFNPLFKKDDFKNEQGAILAERGSLFSDSNFIMKLNARKGVLSLPNNKNYYHPYRNTIIGPEENIKNASALKVRFFYQKFYKPSLMSLVIVGDKFDEDKIINQLIKLEDRDNCFTIDEVNQMIKKCEKTRYNTGCITHIKEEDQIVSILINSRNPKYCVDESEYWERLDSINNSFLYDLFDYWLGTDHFSILQTLFRKELGLVYFIQGGSIWNRYIHYNQIVTKVPLNKLDSFIHYFADFVNNKFKSYIPNKEQFKQLIKNLSYDQNYDYYDSHIEAKKLVSDLNCGYPLLNMKDRYKQLNKIKYDEFVEFIYSHFSTKQPFKCFISAVGPEKINTIINKNIMKRYNFI